jgi:hypothetical protein
VIFAISATAMLGAIGLLYSFGVILAERRTLQTAADAASLSGTWQLLRELASDNRSDDAVLSSIVKYATSNGVPSDGTTADAAYLSASYLDVNGLALGAVGAGGSFPAQARGVSVSVRTQAPTILPAIHRVYGVLVQNTAASIAKPTVPPTSATLVIPLAIPASDAATAYAGATLYDLFAGGRARTLDLRSRGAPGFGSSAINAQYWSDGQHLGSWQLSWPTDVNLADEAYFDPIAAGLRDNVRRQGLVDASGATYALVTLPIYDTASAVSAHVVGFAQFKLRSADISSMPTRGLFVPYPVAAWGTPAAPLLDLGAVLVAIAA